MVIKSKDNKNSRILTAIASLEEGDTISLTPLARRIKVEKNGKTSSIHMNKLEDLLDLFDSLREAGIELIRDKNRRIKKLIKTNASLSVRTDIRDIKKQQITLSGEFDKLKTLLESKRWINQSLYC